MTYNESNMISNFMSPALFGDLIFTDPCNSVGGLGVRPIAILDADALYSDFIFEKEGSEVDWEWSLGQSGGKTLESGLVRSASE